MYNLITSYPTCIGTVFEQDEQWNNLGTVFQAFSFLIVCLQCFLMSIQSLVSFKSVQEN